MLSQGLNKLIVSIMFFIVGTFAVVLLIAVYKHFYAKYINKKLKEQSYNSNVNGERIPDSHNMAKFIAVVVFFYLFFSINSNIKSLISEVEKMDNRASIEAYNSKISEQIEDGFDKLAASNKKTQRKESLISNFEVDYGDFNVKEKKANIIFRVMQNNYDVDSSYYLLIGKKNKIKLEAKGNGVCEGSAELSVSKIYSKIVFVKEDAKGNSESEIIRPQEDWDESVCEFTGWYEDVYGEKADYGSDHNLWYKYLLDLVTTEGDGCYYDLKKDEADFDYSVDIEAYKPDEAKEKQSVKEARIIIESDGEMVEEIPLSVENLNSKGKDTFKLKKKIKGEKIKIKYEIKDAYGYTYKHTIFSKKGIDGESYGYDDTNVYTYDENGKKINR